MKNIIKYTGLFFIILFSCVSVFFSLYSRTYDIGFRNLTSYASFFENRFYDFRMMQTMDQNTPNPKLILADIDDDSIKRLGSWPITRSHWGTMVRKLRGYGAKVIAFDVFFSEASQTCNDVNPDDELISAIEYFHEIPNNRVIMPYNLEVYGTDHYPTLPEDLYLFALNTKAGGVNYDMEPTIISNSVYPLQGIIDAEASLGFIEASADNDGVIRHYKALAFPYREIHVPSYGLSSYMHWIGEFDENEEGENKNVFKTELDLSTQGGVPILKTKMGDVELNLRGETKVRWIGGADAYTRIPIYQIIEKDPNDPELKKLFEGSLVFVGATAYGAHDLRNTPIDSMLPGVLFHMNFVQMLIDGHFFKKFIDSAKLSWALLVISVLLLLLVQFKENPIFDLFTLVVLISGLYYSDTFYFIPQGYETKLFWCFFALVLCYSWNTIVNFYMANQDKAFLKNAFGSYISPELIDEMYEAGSAPTLGGTSGIRTAYFTDIQGFSSFSEKLSATQLVELLNEYLTAMTDILLEEKGTLDKYEGDAIIAFFGAPMELPDHAKRACMVAHRMQEALLKLRKKWVSEGDKWPKIVHDMRMRIGINSGDIVTGNMGSASRMNYTMMGDSVNLAARLEESAKQYGIFTQVAKETVELAGDEFLWRELDTIRVVGKSIPVTSYDLLGLKATAPDYLKELADKFSKAILLYKAQKWDEAIELFKHTLELEYMRFPDLKGVKTNPSEIYIKRCEDYKVIPPPPEWDGVYTLTSK
ncbi:CHASE2 domain-containing protein [Halobacteriovorax sp. RT-2-4]|uniref:CHASE2 domain-containing protein n=1 Tax=unclassified Halobacteriovorax TaxID=2639665 RepID=UPI00399B9A5A